MVDQPRSLDQAADGDKDKAAEDVTAVQASIPLISSAAALACLGACAPLNCLLRLPPYHYYQRPGRQVPQGAAKVQVPPSRSKGAGLAALAIRNFSDALPLPHS